MEIHIKEALRFLISNNIQKVKLRPLALAMPEDNLNGNILTSF